MIHRAGVPSVSVLCIVLGLFGAVLNTGASVAQQRDRVVRENQSQQSPVLAPGDIHRDSSRVYVFVGKGGLVGHEHAIEGRLLRGQIHLGHEHEAGELVFDIPSFLADTAAARKYIGLSGTTDVDTQRQTTDNMLGADVLNVGRFPTAVFRVESANPTGKTGQRGHDEYLLTGTFTLHGMTRPVRVSAEAEPRDGWIHLRGVFSIKQTDYGMRPFSKAFGAVAIADELRIWGDLWIADRGLVARQEANSKQCRQ